MLLLLVGCSLEKQSAVNRGLQNLTARYNILFNANELLQQKQESYASTFIDNYDQVLNVYQDTASHLEGPDKDLQAVVEKANAIITIKEQSHYIGDAYMLLGKAAHLNADYFTAVEYFGYVLRSFNQNANLAQEARAWQIRSLVYLGQLRQAKTVIDTALLNISPKAKKPAGYIYAALLQYEIDAQDYPNAIEAAKKAIAFAPNSQLKARWIFIMAQLYELSRQPANAYESYTRVVKSNAPFVMAFNAELNRIRIDDVANGRHLSRADRLKSLLKNDNNTEFTDQIYYQLGELALSEGKTAEAVKFYKESVKRSVKNQNQRALSYLRLADINFKTNGNYIAAKQYYDSTLLNLPPNYPGYRSIRTKADNLQLLANNIQTISREDTLQALAKLPEAERTVRINEFSKAELQKQQLANTTASAAAAPMVSATDQLTAVSAPTTGNNAGAGASSFYFDNTNAISQGYTDFKRKWGNRVLEDNWRRSMRSNADLAINTQNTTQNVDPAVLPANVQKSTADVAATDYKQQMAFDVPITPELMAKSNQRIYNAYMDLATFYRDVLNDKDEAIAMYLQLISRFPQDENLASNYYNLYRLYANDNADKSNEYKNLILSRFPNSTFARVITDPDYAQRMNDKDAELNAFYNQIYDLYVHRQYPQVISRANELLQQYPTSMLAPQMAYLRALASGHQEKVIPFRLELMQIASTYPNDGLITPLVRQHLSYIDNNQAEMATRKFAITDADPNAAAFIPPLVVQPQQVAVAKAPVQQPPVTKPEIKKPEPKPVAATKVPQQPGKPAPVAPSIFSKRDSTNYYFTINVNSGTTNLSSSRFGVGQFNRTTYQGVNIKHQLKPIGADNQLIYVGRFMSLEDAKEYARKIIPLMPQIMKVSADKYSFFIITQENLDKLADRKLLDSYIEYYQKNF